LDPAYVSALAALAGSAIGGLTSLAASWLTGRGQFNAQRLAHDIDRREELYKDFIEKASESFVDALEHDKPDVSKLVRLYAIVSRMRVLSSQGVVEKADRVILRIIETYLGPNKTPRDIAHDVKNHSMLDPLHDFSNACRDEFRMQAVAPRYAVSR